MLKCMLVVMWHGNFSVGQRERERERSSFKRETEHLWIRQLCLGIGEDRFLLP